MIDPAVAGRYAHALFLLTERRGETDAALPDLQAVGALMAPHTPIGVRLASPQVLLSDKRAVCRRVLDGKVRPSIVMFVDLLLRKHRLPELPSIVEQFQARVEKKQGVQRATVSSAVPLTEGERTRLLRELERLTGGTIRLTATVDPALVGGASVRLGDRLIDRSVKTLLEAIEHQLSQASV